MISLAGPRMHRERAGSQLRLPKVMMGADEGGGVGIKGTLPQRQLARALRRLREAAGLSLEEAAPQLDWSASKLSRIETAEQGVDVHGVRSMLDLYNVGGPEWGELIELTREARKKNEWLVYGISNRGYPRLEMDATVVHNYQLAYIPGLLQTEDYMRVLFRSSPQRLTDAEVDQEVKARLFRQRRLTTEPALELVTVVDESVLCRAVGGVEVMRAQLQQILTRAALPSVCLQVLPFALGVHAGLNGSFTVLNFGDPDEPEIAYVEHTAKTLHLEKEGDVRACKLAFDQRQSQARSPHDSAAFIERLAADL